MTVKKTIFLLAVLFSCFLMHSKDRIEALSEFTLLGEWNLYSSPEFSDGAFAFRTLNHEGGLKLKELSQGDSASGGQWHYVLLVNGQCDVNGVWFKPYLKFWIFIPDDAEFFDYNF